MSAVLSPISSSIDALDDAVADYLAAKRVEDNVRKARLGAEQRILALVPAKEEGSSTTDLPNGLTLVTTGKLTYKCDDLDALLHLVSSWPANMRPVKTETKLDETGCKYLRANDPEAWAALATVVTVAPAKTSISVKA
jgi:hypothetical protein